MANSKRDSILVDIQKSLVQLQQVIGASLRPLPTETGDGTYITHTTPTGLINDLPHVKPKDVETLIDVAKAATTGDPQNDRDYIMERVIQLAAALPTSSRNGQALTDAFIRMLWNGLQHPPTSCLGKEFIYRAADGSNNNLYWPQIGAAGTHYARSVEPKTILPGALPEPEVLFDSLLARKTFTPHPNKISSVLFYLASIIIHDLFRTDRTDFSKSLTSSYLDLSPLYGSNQEEQNAVRTFKDGKLKADCFSDTRVLGFPPGVGVLLIMFNRFHNYVVQNLAVINEDGRFTKPDESDTKAYAKYDNDLFQTGRLVTCGLYVNIILKDYVRTILNLNRTNSVWALDPRTDMKNTAFGEAPPKATGNQVSAEFNLLYRWHACISERDEKWTEGLYNKLFPGVPSSQISVQQFVEGIARWERALPADPQERPFADLKRGANGSFDDDDLVKIFKDGVEDCAGAFGASHVPTVLKAVEVLGIRQARSWNLATLNEFRKFFNLTPHQTFEDINSDPYIADQLKHLYDHPDYVELYPGLIIEDAKDTKVPGSGLCTNYTISRGILFDAVVLIRGDRYCTVDWNPKNVTRWAFNEVNYDNSVDQGHVFYKLVFRAFPEHFRQNSIYAHFPLVVPSENQKILTNLGVVQNYSFDAPSRVPPPEFINSYAAATAILSNQENFKVTWGEAIEFLMHKHNHPYGKDFMLSGDDLPNAASRKRMHTALYREHWESEVKKFYKDITLKLLYEHSYQIAGVNQVDIVRDIANLAQVHFCASLFSLPLKTESNPREIYSDTELYLIMAVVFTCIFFDADIGKSFPLRQIARNLTQQLGELVMVNVQLINKTGWITQLVGRLHRHDALADYGIHMIQQLLKTGVPVDQLVWTHLLPTAGGMVANQAQLFSQCLDYYLSEEGSIHLPEINRLAKPPLDVEADTMHSFMEGARLGATVGLYRDVAQPTVVEDNGKKLNLRAGQRVLCNLIAASKDPTAFPEPDKVKLDRDLNLYIHFGYGPHQCLGYGISQIALTTMFKVVGRLDNLRRAPGAQGQLKKIPAPGGFTMYMTADHSSFFPFPTTMKIQWDGDIVPM
ncbi:Linoleate 8R-lipoxygenase [Rasamsonia emersonii CBS 393.64]|uniref:linoleate 8R-lipoxygenase n=1 Tax=Rasamsonia emersonii (strain ATCC 16479 / CBS 393.64 / IMI 116815) TaxID=1408163 RepID=A0A0F4YQY7_RASE3|nr:Linoleate 8R-lipoxygenase [Rasamsonia emersonii CBS 393.64]KKA20520.1 Linoleate 8R-lipoxygenase [Rasamsonia emersonii CBS 393.64]